MYEYLRLERNNGWSAAEDVIRRANDSTHPLHQTVMNIKVGDFIFKETEYRNTVSFNR